MKISNETLCRRLHKVSSDDCNQRTFENGNSVCVCDESYCDTVPPLTQSTPGTYQIFSSSKSQLGFAKSEGLFGNVVEGSPRIRINRSKKFQTVIGFGGAFTDSAGINILSLPEEARDKLLESYFGDDGVGYNLCRVPIGGTDFSTRPYSYDDNPGDVTLEKFQLQEEDLVYKIPLITRARILRGDVPLRLFASPWTAPPWMKTNNDWPGEGQLLEEYYQLWADYFIKFFAAYQENGVEFWGVTTQNEPLDGFLSNNTSQINAMGWTPDTMNKWIGENFGPTIRNSAFSSLKIITFDENRWVLHLLPQVLENELTLSFLDGIGVHWYLDRLLPPGLLNFTRTDKKDLFLINTEACQGFLHSPSVDLGSWERGAGYFQSIHEDFEFGAAGWVDWNMALDVDGGPVYISNPVDSPIIVNATAGEFYKQPMYYALGHFSKFVIPNSVRIEASISQIDGVQVLAFERPDNLTAVTIHNSNSADVEVVIEDFSSASISIAANSINTLIYATI